MRTVKKFSIAFAKWVFIACAVGVIGGIVGSLFHMAVNFATGFRECHSWTLYLMPLAGLFIIFSYRVCKVNEETGTNLIISSVRGNIKVPLLMAPLIFLGTVLTHLTGGSAGREGAALQLGGSIGNGIGKLFHFDDKDKHIMIMCGMSACFSALFGTPMAAAIFSMEVVSVGIMYYAALVPCVISSLVAHGIAVSFGISQELFLIDSIPSFGIGNAVRISVLAILCAGISILFCVMLHQSEALYKHFFKNPYVRVFVGGCIVIVLTLLVGNQNYNGTGVNIIAQCIDGTVRPEAFLLKMIFTAATLGAGYKGGEIVPSFFTGAAFGCLFGNLLGFSPALCTAVGMAAVFCGVTNCPITSILIAFEMFGFKGVPFYLIAVSISYAASGYYGLYKDQTIVYSKYKAKYVNKPTRF